MINFNTPNTEISFESKDRIDMEHQIKHELLFKDFKKELSKIILTKLSDKIREIDQDDDEVDDYNE